MRVLVCGGRDYGRRSKVVERLDKLLPLRDLVLIHGGCPTGVDRFADDWAMANFVAFREFPADWNRWGRAAGPIRNQEMVDVGRPHLVIAFPGGAGTADMVRRARAAGVRVEEAA